MIIMLRELYIENLAVIEKASVNFQNSLNIFTGETGAGKSILIGGINAALGQRVSRDIVRTGAKKAVVSAVFDSIPKGAVKLLEDNGISVEDGDLIVSREISADGKSSAHINSRPVNASLLRDVGAMLVNIHGQHDNQALLSPEKHLELLDRYAGLEDLLEDYRADFKRLQGLSRDIKRLALGEQEKENRVKKLAKIVGDIKPMELTAGEDDEIERRFKLADSSRELTDALMTSTAQLYGMDDAGGASLAVTEVCERLSPFSDDFSDLEHIIGRLESLRIELDDIASELIRLTGSVEINPSEFAALSKRRDDILILKKRYSTDVDGLISLCEQSGEELLALTGSENRIEELSAEKTELLKQVSRKAAEISKKRAEAAERFCAEVASELEFLNMPSVKIAVLHEKGKLTVNGMDSIEFLISANIGEEPKPIAKIASGGELSRIMLALKNVIADRDDVPTLIFDEIDTGVSGRAAGKIGVKLRSISRMRQVLCVTHLTQIAVQADCHLLIEKTVESGRTVTTVTELDRKGQINEIARLLGGENVTETTLKNAAELIDAAHNIS